jgi:predicted nuclease with RNAse H fold
MSMKKLLFAGLDLAGSPLKKTGWAVIDEEMRLFEEPQHIFSDDEIKKRIKDISPEWIGIDAPLTLPLGKKGNYNSRLCDRELAKFGVSAISPALLGSLTFRGVHLAKILKKEGYSFVEVYPRATERILKIRVQGKKPSLKWRQNLQNGLSLLIKGIPSPKERLFSTHILDAILCAYTVYCRAKGEYEEVGDEEGVVVVPRLP